MKRTKFIAGALVLSMGLLGTGYAYWTDAITVNTTVKTGNFDINYRKDGLGAVAVEDADAKYVGKYDIEEGMRVTPGTLKAELIPNDETGVTSFKVTNIYPTAGAVFNTRIVNDGSIGAKVDDIAIASDMMASEAREQLRFLVGTKAEDVSFIDNTQGVSLEELEGLTEKLFEEVQLEPGEGMDLYLGVMLMPGAGNETQAENVEFGMNIKWTQFNAQK